MLVLALAVLGGLAQAAALAWWGAPGDQRPALWWLQVLGLAALVGVLQRVGTHAPGADRAGVDLAGADAQAGEPDVLHTWAANAAAPPTRWQRARRTLATPGARAFGLGWLFATAWLAGTFWWLFISMHVYGGLAAPLSVLAVLALAAFLGLYYAAACVLWQRLARRAAAQGAAAPAVLALAFAALWTLAEWARGTWLTGFPWGAIGYAHVDGPLASLAPWVGVYGVGFVAAWCAALLAPCLQWLLRLMRAMPAPALPGRPPALAWLPGLWLAALVLGSALLGLVQRGFTTPAGELRVQLLQGNIAQDEKFEFGPGINRSLSWYGQALVKSDAPLVVTAETAIPLLPTQLDSGYWLGIQAPFTKPGSGRLALVAVPLGSMEAGYTNSLKAFGEGPAGAYRYNKHHLVPFGEFIPSGFRWFVNLMNIPLGDFDRGDLPQPPLAWQGQRIAPNICYEDLFGEELGASFRSHADAPTLLLNTTNLGWFGNSVAIDQHLAISRMRTLELERPMLRATNTGTTALIDHTGRVVQALPRFTAGVLDVTAQGREGRTPYAVWVAHAGLWPLVALCLALLGWAGWRTRLA